MKAIISEKGQVTIPKPFRDRLGFVPGTIVDFEAETGRLVGRKHVVDDPFLRWKGRGRLPRGVSVDRYLRETRG